MRLRLTVNGTPVERDADPGMRLIDLLRDGLGLSGTKEGCGKGQCGACTVLLDGEAVNACLVLAGQCGGREIRTVEGLDGEEGLPQAFLEEGAVQCGYCTPGMLLSARALLDADPDPGEETIRRAIAGNLCRCSGYARIVRAVRRAAGPPGSGGEGA